MMIGHGYDIHRLQPGGQLVLAGVVVSREISPVAHSDGDVAIHALVDALLGAMGWGDIGESFPDTDPKWKGADSSIFLQSVMRRLKESGFEVENADLTILAEKPRLKPFKDAMIARLRSLLGIARVNIKAGTNEGCGEIGRRQAIAAHAVVLVKPAAQISPDAAGRSI